MTFSASGYPGLVFCPVRDCRSGHFHSFSAGTAEKFLTMHPSRIYGHTDDLDMMLFITVGFWFGLGVIIYLIFSGFRALFRGCPANVMSAAMLWKARLCFLSIVVRITFEHKTKSCQPNANLTGDGTRSRPDLGTMQYSSMTLKVYFRKVWKLLLQRLHHSNDIRVKTYFRIILGHPIYTGWSINNRTILNCSHFLAGRYFCNPFSPKWSVHIGKLSQQH